MPVRGAQPISAISMRELPSVDEILRSPQIAALSQKIARPHVVEIVRARLAALRENLTSGEPGQPASIAEIECQVVADVAALLSSSLRAVINATGVILHTNLGRAPLPTAVLDALRATATNYNNLEYDLRSGKRGRRDVHTADLLRKLLGCEAAVVVNNCAAAVLVTLAALSKGGETIVSRGELIEIGDGFRIPEIMEHSGAILREVGTTNRTRAADYQAAITERTRLLMRVHPSNFKVTGFTEKPSLDELVKLSATSGIPLVEDLGSGSLVDLSAHGITEPTVGESIRAGVGLVIFSGDKLLGGPQAGVIAGKKDLVAKVRRHPLFRALRVDKLTIAALEATLRLYLQDALHQIPALQMIRLSVQEIATRASRVAKAVSEKLGGNGASLSIVDGFSLAGGGSTPSQSLATKLLCITSPAISSTEIEQRLRLANANVAVIARVEDDQVLIDLRTVLPEQEEQVIAALTTALQ